MPFHGCFAAIVKFIFKVIRMSKFFCLLLTHMLERKKMLNKLGKEKINRRNAIKIYIASKQGRKELEKSMRS